MRFLTDYTARRRLRAHARLTTEARSVMTTDRWFRRQRQQATPIWLALVELLEEERQQEALLTEAHALLTP